MSRKSFVRGSSPISSAVESASAAQVAEPLALPENVRGRFGMLADACRCANRDCARPLLDAGVFAWSFGAEHGVYRPGQILCVSCAIDLGDLVRKRWEQHRAVVARGHSEREVDRVAMSGRPRRRSLTDVVV